jgi:UDP-N-acetylenolpyruvoylglucosamine reductase
LLLQHFDASDEKVQRFIEVGKISAGWLIQEAGLKGTSVGHATVSEVHGNFIVGDKGVTANIIGLLESLVKTFMIRNLAKGPLVPTK